jgi:CxxC motif-containing protein
MKKELICIVCPIGCHMTAELDKEGHVLSVAGNTCPRGKAYAEAELTHPTRTLTTTVTVANRPGCMLPVKTAAPISKNKLLDAMDVIRTLKVNAPVESGAIVLADLLGETDLIATGSIE